MNRVAFRVDASLEIGTGHFMRCLTLANSLKKEDIKIRFISRSLPEHLRSLLTATDYEFIQLENGQNDLELDEIAHAAWLGVSQAQDAADSIKALAETKWDWLVVDHYALDYRWESLLRKKVNQILVIDDLADRRHDCNILLDQNYYSDIADRYNGLTPKNCLLLLGPKYALLREEFRLLQQHVKPRTQTVKRILVFFGGVDANNHTGLAIQSIADSTNFGLHVDVVIGAQHPCLEQIKTACIFYGFICHVQTNKMAELMLKADLAIGAVGSTTWERCAMGLPSIVLVLAENQRKVAKDLDAAGVLISLGDAYNVTKPILSQAIKKITADNKKRAELSFNSLQLMKNQIRTSIVDLIANQHA